jgi:quinoprotein glucose dehydrogenase
LMKYAVALALTLMSVAASSCASRPSGSDVDGWGYYGHDPGGIRYSPLTQITRSNVSQLRVAWTIHTGDVSDGTNGRQRSGFETTPILVDDTLYFTTPFNRVIAVNPETGQQRWAYDPHIDLTWSYGDGLINRGVASWLDAVRAPGQPCRRRIFEATLDARLVALDGATGQPCTDFGDGRQVSLTDVSGYRRGAYHMTSPPAVIDDLVIVGSAINDNNQIDMPSGVVRAFDARSGKLRWGWNPIPTNVPNTPNATPAWRSGAANAWSIMSVDPDRHLVFVPTGSASPDYFGGFRPGDGKWADAVVALRAGTGEMAWGFQLVHHDLWDYDSAPPPLLAMLPHDGQNLPVLIQGNKTGFLYVLNRENGAPVWPVEERQVPQSDVPGEATAQTQPFPSRLPALTQQRFSPEDAWGPTDADRDACRRMMDGLRNDGVFTPPSLKGSLAVPGNLGGITWSGYAFDPAHNLLVVNTNNLPALVKLVPRVSFDDSRSHQRESGEYAPQTGAPYGMVRRFLQSPSNLPCGAPPWGTLVAVDMHDGEIRWQVPLGSMENFGGPHAGVPPGSINLGGPIVTAGGIVFIAGTFDPYLRAFDTETGQELWKGLLPASGHATPMTYKLTARGKQYVVVAAGGHPKVSEESLGDALVAFTLP